MEFTGERMILGKVDLDLQIEHLNRYYFARQFVFNKKVLDAACGSGYGSDILAKTAQTVDGIDISEEAINYCKEKFMNNKIRFECASVDKLPYSDDNFDTVVSFETIEHINEEMQNKFIMEIQRVLKPGGVLVISSPNHSVYKERGENHFHVKELCYEEFKNLLEKSFKNVYIYSQKNEISNSITKVGNDIGNVVAKEIPESSEYLIAVCSNHEVTKIKSEIYIRNDNKLKKIMDWAVSNHKTNERNNIFISNLTKKSAEYEREIENKNNIIVKSKEEYEDKEVLYRSRIEDLNNTIVKSKKEYEDKEVLYRSRIEDLNNTIVKSKKEYEDKEVLYRSRIEELFYNKNMIVSKNVELRESLNQISYEKNKNENELNLIKSSRAYRLSRKISFISNKIIPKGSRRRLLVKILWRGLRHPILFLRALRPKKIMNVIQRLFYGDKESLHDKSSDTITNTLEIKNTEKIINEYEMISIPKWTEPLVSIIIPVYNQFEYTYNCIKSIKENSEDVTYEIIIANDCSNDLTIKINDIIKGVNVITNKINLRFLKNCNNAAKQTKGKYILFLNNDTIVHTNWLSPLVTLMEKDEKIGMVGSKLVYANGKLQEAGGIIWNDASAWNYGNGQDPNMPEYNYVKEVDYISGAAIMIKHDLWKKIGGFDERYSPAYYEDSDLAFEVRNHGFKVVYQPLSVVTHFEGISNGKDIEKGQKSYQVMNKIKFYDKWKDVLSKENFANGINVFEARDRSARKKCILFVDHYVPTYDMDAGSRTIFQYLQVLSDMGYNIKFIGDNFNHQEPYTTILQQMGIEVLFGLYYMENWKLWVNENSKYLDYAFLNRPHISEKYIDSIKSLTSVKIVYNVCDLGFLRLKREYGITKNLETLKESEKWQKKEFQIMEKADIVFTLSTDEKRIIDEHFKFEKALICPIFIFKDFNKKDISMKNRKDLLFVGGFAHSPNKDGVLWFLNEIFPKIVKEIKDIKFHIVGSYIPTELKELRSENIIIEGFASDERLKSLYNECRLCVIPLRYGAGVKGKTIEAMYNRIPIVSTSIGIEGLVGIKEIITPKDSSEGFAEEVINIYNNDEKLNAQIDKSISFVKKYFSYDKAVLLFNKVYPKDIKI